MTQQHTPGPWHFNEDQHLAAGNREYGILTVHPDFTSDEKDWPYHPRVAGVNRGHGCAPNEIAKANARLIAAAPELLRALEVIQPELKGSDIGHIVDAAIKKAKGYE